MYSVVCFPKEEDQPVSLIPSSWICTSRLQCFWPRGPAGTLIKQRKPPGPNWDKVPITILREEIDSFKKGKQIERKASENKNLQTTDSELQKTRSKQKTKYKKQDKVPFLDEVNPSTDESNHLSDYDALSSDEDITARVAALTSPSLDHLLQSTSQIVVASPQRVEPQRLTSTLTETFAVKGTPQASTFCQPPTSSQPPTSCPPPQSCSAPRRLLTAQPSTSLEGQFIDALLARQKAFEEVVIKEIAEIKTDVKELLGRTAYLRAGRTEQLNKEIPFKFPLETKASLAELNKWICTNEDNFRVMVDYCCTFGGDKFEKIVRTILARILSPSLSKVVNWTGGGQLGKTEFRGTGLMKVVLESTKKQKPTLKDLEIETVVKNWFRNSRDLGGRQQRKGNDGGSQTTEENSERNQLSNSESGI